MYHKKITFKIMHHKFYKDYFYKDYKAQKDLPKNYDQVYIQKFLKLRKHVPQKKSIWCVRLY